MTLTTTVMVMETTGALQLIVPIMITVFVAKVIHSHISAACCKLHTTSAKLSADAGRYEMSTLPHRDDAFIEMMLRGWQRSAVLDVCC